MLYLIPFITALLMFVYTPVVAGSSVRVNPNMAPEVTQSTEDGDKPVQFTNNRYNFSPRRDDIIGERFQAGDTWYDFHANGSVGKMIAVGPNGGVHITWGDGFSEDVLAGERHQKYNYFDPESEEWIAADGETVDFGMDRGGFGSLALTAEEEPRAMIFFHGKDDTTWTGFCGIDFEVGLGVFETVFLPRYPQLTAYFPQAAVSPEGRIHVAMQRRDRRMIGYAVGELDRDGIPVFDENLREVGETHRTTLRIACSAQSERTAIVWMESRIGFPIPEEWQTGSGFTYNNDLMLAWTDDGEEWNFNNPLNITDNYSPNPDLEGDAAYGDTLRPHVTMDVIFDPDDNIHVIYDARGFWQQPIPEDSPPVDGITVDASYLFHWSEATEEITPVADGWYTHREVDENDETTRWPVPGAYKSNVCAPSMAYDEAGDLYCVYSYFPLEDYSEQNYCNGDIAVTVSEDNGATWYYPTMITATRTHLAEVGESECEIYPTVANVVDDYLHISYELDTEPGTPVEDYTDREEIASLCPWIYHRVPLDEIARDSIWEGGPNWHSIPPESVEEEVQYVANKFAITGMYPNPFNSQTTIKFNVNRSEVVSIKVYDLDGRLVTELFEGEVLAGHHQVVWGRSNLSAGIYLVRLSNSSTSSVRKAVLLK